MTVIVGVLRMIKKETDKHINKITSSPSLYQIQKNCTLRNGSSPLESVINVTEKYHTKEAAKNIEFT